MTRKRTHTTAALTAIALLTAAAPAAAKPIYYNGKTDNGSPISFKRSANKISAIDALVPTTCVSPDSKVPRSGGDLFKPPGAFKAGTTRKTTVKQDTAFFHDPVTKHYRITVKKGKRGLFKVKLHVNFSFQALGYSAFGDPQLDTYVCRGDDSFSVR